ncbi:hypothetical protein WQE_07147 [Paraburkholderia hospita]|uniref:Preprotein translocase subunit SecA n=1 Tax=Paraburkholderia hospita TaxID=169430 RepID=A0ABN0FSR6_9BURK|nr:hypothetical protein [Paraburkholderia hospita]EIN01788.1 hypothetical protein WQE_07147 [Paraburkholderia hospita]OUL80492.1 hypothetical protein CA602_27860 [Paraburkholderia hospita]OUL96342.1 hypothetical protein CA601_02535 [Paraburkholderia hospita]
MLSPHEIAALMLIETNPYPDNLDPEDLDVLCGRQLVALEGLASGCAHVQLTAQGRSVLRSIGRLY